MMNRILGMAAVAAAGLVAGGWFLQQRGDEGAGPGSTQFVQMPGSAQAQTAAASDVDTTRVIEMAAGAPDAPVTIVEYSSFTCPHCASFNQGVYRQIYEQYVETGIARIVKREVYFDAFGLWAGLVARCGGPERYFGIVEMLYQNQREWSRAQPAAGQSEAEAVADALRRIGRRAGMNDEELNACLSDREMATAMMEVYRVNAQRDGITSTPSFMINGRSYSNMNFADFQTAIEAARR